MKPLSHSDASKVPSVQASNVYKVLGCTLGLVSVCVLLQQEAAFVRLFSTGFKEQLMEGDVSAGTFSLPINLSASISGTNTFVHAS